MRQYNGYFKTFISISVGVKVTDIEVLLTATYLI